MSRRTVNATVRIYCRFGNFEGSSAATEQMYAITVCSVRLIWTSTDTPATKGRQKTLEVIWEKDLGSEICCLACGMLSVSHNFPWISIRETAMLKRAQFLFSGLSGLFLVWMIAFTRPCAAGDKVLGEVRFQADNAPTKTAGVWVDGKYVGYLDELKGSNKLLLVPGEHEISVRQAGYQSVNQKVYVTPNEMQTIRISLAKDPRAHFASATGKVKLSVVPDRAAVFDISVSRKTIGTP
jgi:hypothetical protein